MCLKSKQNNFNRIKQTYANQDPMVFLGWCFPYLLSSGLLTVLIISY